jgi:Sulfotransferase family
VTAGCNAARNVRGCFAATAIRQRPALNQNPSSPNPAAPVVIGGVGGSGTRVFARIFMQAGLFLGSDLNLENDNLWFTLLFRRPRWYRKVGARKKGRISAGLHLLTKAMLGGNALTLDEVAFLTRAAIEMSVNFQVSNKTMRGIWPFERARNMLRAAKTPLPGNYRGWGWKEPNSHIYLPYLFRHFPALKYIHVIRHGLDLAFSINQVQLYNWSFLFDLERPKSRSGVPAASLKYWVRANQRAVEFGKNFPDRFLFVNFDEVCRSPAQEINRILNFTGVKLSADESARLCELPQKQASSGRYLQRDCSVFDPEDVDAVRRFGFEVKI